MNIYFPSCNFTKASPDTAKKVRAYLAERMPVAGCCRFDKNEYGAEDKAVYFCQACRETLESRIATVSIWEYLLTDESFAWPDHSGTTVGLQDCWRDREKPEIHEAVREILKKMNMELKEIEEAREKSVFCGNLHFEPKDPKNIELMNKYPDKPIYEMPADVEKALMTEQVKKFDAIGVDTIITVCNRCTLGLNTGGGNAVHLLNLIFE